MACTNCSSDKNGNTAGKVAGCRSNGGCQTGGCNRMNVYDWLSDLPFSAHNDNFKITEVSFSQGSRKTFFRNLNNIDCHTGDMVLVEAATGYDIGRVSLSGELVRLQMKKHHIPLDADLPRIIRRATERDLDKWEQVKQQSHETMLTARVIAASLNLDMKIGDVEYQGDGRKATFYYTADDRVDFRELIKVFAKEFRIKIEMRQIGARQEAARIGGIGTCGRELCCSSWLTEFKSVSTLAARYQNLTINQSKLSGQCGRLKCCLNYELDTYLDALVEFPTQADTIQTLKGTARLIKTDIFKRLMWYALPSSSPVPLNTQRVKEILRMNKRGEMPEDLASEAATITTRTSITQVGFHTGVGEIKLEELDPNIGKRKRKKKKNKDKAKISNESPKDITMAPPPPIPANEHAAKPIKENTKPKDATKDKNTAKPQKIHRKQPPKSDNKP